MINFMNKQLPILNNRNEQQGFVLLFAIVVSAVIFFIGAGIFSIAYKELIISSLGKDSQKSIFMADSAIECALQVYRDGKFDGGNLAIVGNFSCFGELVSIDGVDASTTSLAFRLSLDDACARVSVSRETSKFVFFAQGYNKCNEGSPVENFPGLTERVYKVEVPR